MMQSAISEAITMILLNEYAASCLALERAASSVGVDAMASLPKEYRIHAAARKHCVGFEDIPHAEWNRLTMQQRKTYRLEMLYYFWQANQDM